MKWIIYVLKCPRTDEVRYVGFTSNRIQTRLQKHMSEARKRHSRTRRGDWIFSLLCSGLSPAIEAVESGSGDGWQQSERRWIAHYRALGTKLVNGTDGGDGVIGWGTPEQRSEKMRRQWANMTPERRAAAADRVRAAVRSVPVELRKARAQNREANLTAEQRARRHAPGKHSEPAKHWQASRTPEQRSASAKKANAQISPERRLEIVRKINRNRTSQDFQAMSIKGNAAITPQQRLDAAKKRLATLTPEKRADIAAKIRAGMNALPPEQRSAIASRAAKAQAAFTPEQRSAIAKKTWANVTPEERSAVAEKRMAARTPEQRHAVAVKAGDGAKRAYANMTAEQRADAFRRSQSVRTPEQKAAAMQKAWATRRATLPR